MLFSNLQHFPDKNFLHDQILMKTEQMEARDGLGRALLIFATLNLLPVISGSNTSCIFVIFVIKERQFSL